MAFDTLAAPAAELTAEMSTVALIDACGEMCPAWTAANPDRALAPATCRSRPFPIPRWRPRP